MHRKGWLQDCPSVTPRNFVPNKILAARPGGCLRNMPKLSVPTAPEPGEHPQAPGQPPPAAGVILNPGSKWPVPAPARARVLRPLRGAMHLLYQHYQHAPRIQATPPGAFPAAARRQAACSRPSASSSTSHDLLLDKGFAALINSFRASAHSGVVSHDLTNCSRSTQPPSPSRLSQSPPRPSVSWL